TLVEDSREQLVEALVETGLGLRHLDEAESELEQAFLGVTGETEDDRSAAPEAAERATDSVGEAAELGSDGAPIEESSDQEADSDGESSDAEARTREAG
ncbi:MAG: hypothetical protein ABEN55_16455, partial [Bradymonadaceae bacterium]